MFSKVQGASQGSSRQTWVLYEKILSNKKAFSLNVLHWCSYRQTVKTGGLAESLVFRPSSAATHTLFLPLSILFNNKLYNTPGLEQGKKEHSVFTSQWSQISLLFNTIMRTLYSNWDCKPLFWALYEGHFYKKQASKNSFLIIFVSKGVQQTSSLAPVVW